MQDYTQIALKGGKLHQKMLLRIMQKCKKLQKYGETLRNERNGTQNTPKIAY